MVKHSDEEMIFAIDLEMPNPYGLNNYTGTCWVEQLDNGSTEFKYFGSFTGPGTLSKLCYDSHIAYFKNIENKIKTTVSNWFLINVF